MHFPFYTRCLLLFFLLFHAFFLDAQNKAVQVVRGQVTDLETTLPVRLVSVSALEANLLVYTDREGHYQIKSPKPFSKIRFEAVGYKTRLVDIRPDSFQTLDLALEPVNYQIREVTEKHKKYTNKHNPPMKLNRQQVQNRNKNLPG